MRFGRKGQGIVSPFAFPLLFSANVFVRIGVYMNRRFIRGRLSRKSAEDKEAARK